MTDNKNNDSSQLVKQEHNTLPLVKRNFVMMAIAALLIIAGFMLMGGSPSTESEFNPDIFSTRRIVVGPTIAFLGFVFMGIGIIWRVKKQ